MRTALRLDRPDELVQENLAKLHRGISLDPSTVEKQISAENSERFYHLRSRQSRGGG
jgi:hypothetical protein